MNLIEEKYKDVVEGQPFLTVKHLEIWHRVKETASRAFIDELHNVTDDRELAVILNFTAKVCDRIDNIERVNLLTVPRATTWFSVIFSWLRRQKSI